MGIQAMNNGIREIPMGLFPTLPTVSIMKGVLFPDVLRIPPASPPDWQHTNTLNFH
jgi:hypothetical protein